MCYVVSKKEVGHVLPEEFLDFLDSDNLDVKSLADEIMKSVNLVEEVLILLVSVMS